MVGKKGMTQDVLVKMIIALILLGILIYIAYTYLFKGSQNIAAAGGCLSKPGNKCLPEAEAKSCPGALNVGNCPKPEEYCCPGSTA